MKPENQVLADKIFFKPFFNGFDAFFCIRGYILRAFNSYLGLLY
jgi:hypothetical protein